MWGWLAFIVMWFERIWWDVLLVWWDVLITHAQYSSVFEFWGRSQPQDHLDLNFPKPIKGEIFLPFTLLEYFSFFHYALKNFPLILPVLEISFRISWYLFHISVKFQGFSKKLGVLFDLLSHYKKKWREKLSFKTQKAWTIVALVPYLFHWPQCEPFSGVGEPFISPHSLR